MAEEARILERIRLGEDSVTELKSVAATGFLKKKRETRALLDALTRSLSAFANTRGGWIILGVEDDGSVTGIGTREQADDLLSRVASLCQTAIEPPVTCALEKAEVQGKAVLIVDVPAFAPGRPYRGGREHYVRDANQTRVARRDELRRLLESVDFHYDEQAVGGATRADFDEAAFSAFLLRVYPLLSRAELDAATVERYLQALRCTGAGGTPTVAGILFFGTDPARWFPDARVSIGRVRGVEATSEFQARKEIGGPLAAQYAAAAAFLDEQLRSPSRVEGWQRTELGVPPEVYIPQLAVREALRNALMHRDYRAASQTRIFVFDDRVELINPGGLLNQLSLESIRLGGISQRRNPTIATLLNRLLGRETLGMGVPEMIRVMREAALPEPDFDLSGGHFRVVLRARTPSGV